MSALEPRAPEIPEIPEMPETAAADAAAAGRAQASGGGIMGAAHRTLSIGIISVIFIIAFEATAVGTAMPVAARELDGIALYAFAFSSYFTTSLFGMVLAGQWSDRSGPLGALTSGIGAFAAGLVFSGTAASMWLFVLGRAVQGFGGGLVIVALYVVVGRAYDERLRPAIMAAFAAGWVVPSIVGPLISGTVTEHLGWRWVFLGIPAMVVVPLLVALPEIRRTAGGPVDKGDEGDEGAAPRPFDRRRIRFAFGISLGAGLLQYAAQDLRWLSVVPALAGALLLVPAVRGLMPRGTYLARRGLPAVVLLRGLAGGAFIGAESFLPLMLVTQRGLSPTLAGFSLALGGATWALGSWVQSKARVVPYRERLMVAGMLMVAFSIAAAPAVLIDWVPVWTLALVWGLGCLGMGLVIGPTSVLLLRLSPPEEAGANSAALQISDALANVVLLALGGAAFAALGGGAVGAAHAVTGAAGSGASHPGAFVAVFLPMACVALVGAWVSTRLDPPPSAPSAAAAKTG
ncbi:MFS transporter [Streptomyces sp. NBC_00536]|uniref:MFS transporter n=1 Tax=Streptomyces sp. NBC_00536 TaxID=2975769 RepID=UPI002E80E6A3|nr:MFS transporter [Streptomyces sp. NBC_00536]WUC79309.1 MFS transporter [Streptomyces sp. NBC_00536]